MGSQSSVPWEQSGATFHLHYLGHRIKYGSLEVGNMWVCCSIAFTESFLFWFILVTYNIGIYICYIFIKLAVFILFFLVFIIFNCNVFSALHAKHFGILKKIFVKLLSRLLHSMIHQVVWYFLVFIVSLLVFCLSLSQSA